jgi:hypothetical protein
MEQDRILTLTMEIVEHLRRPEHLHGSRRYGWCSWVQGDLELECSSSRSEYREFSITHSDFILNYREPPGLMIEYKKWYEGYRKDETEFWFEGDAEALEREVMWLRLSA